MFISGAARLLRGVQLVRTDHALASRAVPDHARPTQVGSWGSMVKSAHARRSPEAPPACARHWTLGPRGAWIPKGGCSCALVPAPCPNPSQTRAQTHRLCCAFRHPGGGLTKLKQREAAKLALRQVEVLSMPELE